MFKKWMHERLKDPESVRMTFSVLTGGGSLLVCLVAAVVLFWH